MDLPGLLICWSADNPQDGTVVRLPDESGIVIGTLFEANKSVQDERARRTVNFAATQTRELIESAGRTLIDSHWGSYVLFLHRREIRCVNVLRGPMSVLPCFWVRHHDVNVFFSSVDDCIALRLTRLSINWDCIRAQSAGGDYLGRETGIAEIATLLGGECVEVRAGDVSRRVYWDPASIRATEPVENLKEAATILRSRTQMCVNAWASPHKTILLQLSGGLDSSIVLACLRRAETNPEIISVNFYSRGSGDERKFARSMTKRFGTELIEIESDANVDLRKFLKCARTANPVLNFSAFDAEPKLIQLAHQRNATAIFTGEVGDDLFGHAPAPEVLTESLWSYGLCPTSFLAALDYAELTRVSLWRALHQAVRYKAWQRRTKYWSFYRYRHWIGHTNEKCLISNEAASTYEQMLSRFIHPWFHDVRDMPPGRAMLIYASIMATSTWSQSPFGGSDGSLFLTPIASQPLVEAFTRIPSHLHFKGGENGAVAREAFRSELSDLVLSRGTGKGGPGMWIREVIELNRAFLREVLLDGILVREKIVDRDKLEAMLSEKLSKTNVGVGELVTQLYIESWLRRWIDGQAAMST
jgi:asparagine synthase (glutamine-hydrolysing)